MQVWSRNTFIYNSIASYCGATHFLLFFCKRSISTFIECPFENESCMAVTGNVVPINWFSVIRQRQSLWLVNLFRSEVTYDDVDEPGTPKVEPPGIFNVFAAAVLLPFESAYKEIGSKGLKKISFFNVYFM